ncbi:hypothetical protein [Amycolatopsis sp. YIM 10]|uniref:hypothetical protein n=1 Tax=Amycolatopsis sp. YIM 10 TaxID=2653857 RepID=UPI0012902B9B|nr:hypothetical protein [Amycolatopsis sp. YIM 10]
MDRVTGLRVVLAGGSELFSADGCPLDVNDLDDLEDPAATGEIEFVRSTEPSRAAGRAE